MAGVLGAQLALATPAGAMQLEGGAAATAMHGSADAHGRSAGVSEIAAQPADGPDGSMPVPCDGPGSCGWGLMRCDAAGFCLSLQVLPADRSASTGTAPTSSPLATLLTEPASVPLAVERPPPRA